MNKAKTNNCARSRAALPPKAIFPEKEVRTISSFLLSTLILFGLTACEPRIQLKGGEGLDRTVASTVTDLNACTDNGLNASQCSTATNRYVSPTLGANVTGGGTNASATTTVSLAIPGSKFYDGTTSCQLTDANLVASKILSGTTIFGVTGSIAACIGSNQSGCITSATFLSQSTPATPPAVTDVLTGKQYYAGGALQTGTMTNQGTWDARTAFPGAGYFAGTSNTLSSAQVCSAATGGIDFLGSAGTAVCQGASAGTNAIASNVLSGTYFWNSSGTSTVGTMTDRGAAWDLTTAFPGTGYFSGISSALSSADVCSTKDLLGSPGSASCNGGIASQMASQAFRLDNATIDLTDSTAVSARARGTLANEGSGSASFTSNNALVPNPEFDTDGRYDDVHGGANQKQNYLETVKGRPDKVCGLSGTNAQRVTDCATRNTSGGVNKALYEGLKYGQAGEGDWRLVTLYRVAASSGTTCSGGSGSGCYEVWRDERTGLVWSDNMSQGYNWCQAAGYSSSSDTSAFTGNDCSAGGSYQPSTPISVCADATALAGLRGVSTYQDLDGTNGSTDETPSKGNLTGAARQWRLPTLEDYKLADLNGIRKVLPNMDAAFWSASSYSSYRVYAWMFGGDDGGIRGVDRTNGSSVRCVGR